MLYTDSSAPCILPFCEAQGRRSAGEAARRGEAVSVLSSAGGDGGTGWGPGDGGLCRARGEEIFHDPTLRPLFGGANTFCLQWGACVISSFKGRSGILVAALAGAAVGDPSVGAIVPSIPWGHYPARQRQGWTRLETRSEESFNTASVWVSKTLSLMNAHRKDRPPMGG